MKLTAENIAAIEDFLTRRDNNTPLKVLAVSIGMPNNVGAANTVSHFFGVLRLLGLKFVEHGRPSINAAEMAEFRAWKSTRNTASVEARS